MVNIYCSTLSEFVKPKRQANFKDFKRFGVFKGHVEQKNVVSIYNNSIARSNEILLLETLNCCAFFKRRLIGAC
jgi:hypothetical protein